MKIALIGAGGHAKVVCSVALALGVEVVGYFDDGVEPGVCILGRPVLGRVDQARESPLEWGMHVALGSNQLRSQLHAQILGWGRRVVTLIHPSAVIDPTVRIGDGCVVMAGVVVNVDTVIGRNCILNTSCSVDHDCRLEDHVHLCPGVHLAGGVEVGSMTMIGTGSSVIPGRRIGARCTVGAGASVVRDLPLGVVAKGVPARWV